MPDDCKVFTDASQTAAQRDRVVMLRPREGLRSGKAGRLEAENENEAPDRSGRLAGQCDRGHRRENGLNADVLGRTGSPRMFGDISP
jgi:hypothetical protein